MKCITIAVDSFKGSLSSREVADAFEAGFRTRIPDCEVRKVSIADGGEGTVDALVETLNGDYVEARVADPLGRPIVARYGVIDGGTTAVMEMSAASGLPLIAPEERNPLLTSTYGTGEMIVHAMERGCRKFLVGIGGSATNDGGTGMLRALGFRFLDAEGRELVGGGEILERIAEIDSLNARKELNECEFVVACDVTNPLYGPEGAAYVFAPQKGADAAMVERLDQGLRTYARAIERYNGVQVDQIAGAGAAGGLGGGFKALLGARLERGIDMVLNAMQFDRIIAGSDLVITGEGRIDRQTTMGKAPSGVLREATAQGIPTIAIGGAVQVCDELEHSGFAAVLPIVAGPVMLEVAMQREVAIANVRRTATQIAGLLTLKKLNNNE
ncbi:MAG: glycerate kinase [Rikenellaceae bacterium]|nr:glycerate kinase [Rikenellaceae bacterium]